VLKHNRYSTIRGEPAFKPSDGYSLNAFYDGLTRPFTILGTFAATLVLLYEELPVRFDRALRGDGEALIYLSVVALTLTTMLRVFQSLYFAKRDYSHLDTEFQDIVTFLLVVVLFWGILKMLNQGDPLLGLLFFTLLAVVGLANFYVLLRRRIPGGSDAYDYPSEWRIQLVNTLVCAYCALALLYTTLYVYGNGAQAAALTAVIIISSACAALTFNMVHSHQLTMLPKFLFKNDPDSPEAFTDMFRSLFWRTAVGMDDADIQKYIARDVLHFRALRTVRARKSDVETIANTLVCDFPHVFAYLFSTNDVSRIRSALVGLLSAGGGLAAFGYMSFYVLQHNGAPVGFIKMETPHGCGIYRLAASVSSLHGIIGLFGLRSLPGIYRRRRVLDALQPGPVHGEARLAYIVIYPGYRGQGYGSSTVRLLINALLRDATNDIVTERITLFVRETNPAARLFKSAGFKEAASPASGADDPLATDPSVGRAQFLECTRGLVSTAPREKTVDVRITK
jgi:ribosomal protein S18 acetylase RimI-like enzyme